MADVAIPAARTERILGVSFFNGSARAAVDCISRTGGYVVVPAAPALANIAIDAGYRAALLEADMAIADSGFMVLLWRLLRGRALERISGLRYLQELLAGSEMQNLGQLFLLLPNTSARQKALAWCQDHVIPLTARDCYVAPMYGNPIADATLLDLLNAHRPPHVIVAIGGGTQERLGFYLRERLSYRPAIHCIGAALGFLTGDQQPIPAWADRFYLGWLLRLLRAPRLYGRRFSRAFALPWLIARYGSRVPGGVEDERRK